MTACSNCGQPARPDYAYSTTVCEQWPLCKPKEESMTAEHTPVFTIPVFKGTSPDSFRCSERENGCTFEVAVADGLTKDEAEAKFIAEHPKEDS